MSANSNKTSSDCSNGICSKWGENTSWTLRWCTSSRRNASQSSKLHSHSGELSLKIDTSRKRLYMSLTRSDQIDWREWHLIIWEPFVSSKLRLRTWLWKRKSTLIRRDNWGWCNWFSMLWSRIMKKSKSNF